MTLTFPLAAGAYVFRPLRLVEPNLRGWDVWALQRALRSLGTTKMVVDGIFGPLTEGVVRTFQLRRGLVSDGVAGPKTNATMCELIAALFDGQVPPKLTIGMCIGESALQLGNYTKPYRDGSRDVGVTMENIVVTDAALRESFNARRSIEQMANGLRERHDTVHGSSRFTETHEGAWKYGAVLHHNWPAASRRYADGTIHVWVYTAFDRALGVSRRYRMRDRAQWIVDIGVAGVETGFEWAEHYIATKTGGVTDWIA